MNEKWEVRGLHPLPEMLRQRATEFEQNKVTGPSTVMLLRDAADALDKMAAAYGMLARDLCRAEDKLREREQ